MIRLLALIALIATAGRVASAHELRPGYLEVRQTDAETFDVRFKVPALGDFRLGLYVTLPDNCSEPTRHRTERAGAALLESFVVLCPSGLEDREISIDGLASTFTDALAR